VVENLLDGDPVIHVGRQHSLYKILRRFADRVPERRLHLQISSCRDYSRDPGGETPGSLFSRARGRPLGSTSNRRTMLPVPFLGRLPPAICHGTRRTEECRLAEHGAAPRLTRRHRVSHIVAAGSLPAP